MAGGERVDGRGLEVAATPRRRYGRDLLPGMAIAMFFAVAALWQTIGPFEASGARAVVFAPWLGRSDVWERVVAADGRITREGRWPFLVVVEPNVADFSDRIRRLGAWMELNPKIATDCTAQAAP